MKKDSKKGFTMIEVLIVIAIIGVLSGTVAPKLLKEMRKATVAKVQHNLGVIRSRLSLDETFLDEFPNLYGETNTDLLKAYSIEATPPFTDKEGNGHEATLKVVYSRTDDGGWVYNRDEGEIYANLPNGAYTKDAKYEIWDGEIPAISKITYNGSKSLSYGKLQFKNENGDWEDMKDGDVYPSDIEIQYVSTEDISDDTNKINIGTADGDDAELSDWGIVNGDEAVKTLDDGTVITTSVLNGNLKEFNEDEKISTDNHIGTGIGSSNHATGLDRNNTLKVDVKGEDINKVVFTLDGLGAWFDKNNKNATQVNITAYDKNDKEIDTQSGYRKLGLFSDTYTFETTEPVSYFKLGTTGGGGSYVVQSVNLIKSAQDHVGLTITNPDGTTEEISKDILLDNTNSDDPITINEKLKEDN